MSHCLWVVEAGLKSKLGSKDHGFSTVFCLPLAGSNPYFLALGQECDIL